MAISAKSEKARSSNRTRDKESACCRNSSFSAGVAMRLIRWPPWGAIVLLLELKAIPLWVECNLLTNAAVAWGIRSSLSILRERALIHELGRCGNIADISPTRSSTHRPRRRCEIVKTSSKIPSKTPQSKSPLQICDTLSVPSRASAFRSQR